MAFQRSTSAWRLDLVAITAFGVIASCDRGTGPTPVDYVRVDPSWVVGTAAAAVDGNGLFVLNALNPQWVSVGFAESLAVAVPKFFATATFGNGRDVMEADRGAPIDWNHLDPCSRVSYVNSAFGNPPPPMPGYYRRAIASQLAFAFCGPDGAAQFSVGIPDAPADIRIEGDRLVFRAFGGGTDFSTVGVPIRYPLGFPVTPEAAVREVFTRTGERISQVPVAYDQRDDRGFGQFPLCASWKVVTEAPFGVTRLSDGAVIEVSEVYVRNLGGCFSDQLAFYIPRAAQPTSRWFVFAKDTSGFGSLANPDSAMVPVVGPLFFERVTLVP